MDKKIIFKKTVSFIVIVLSLAVFIFFPVISFASGEGTNININLPENFKGLEVVEVSVLVRSLEGKFYKISQLQPSNDYNSGAFMPYNNDNHVNIMPVYWGEKYVDSAKESISGMTQGMWTKITEMGTQVTQIGTKLTEVGAKVTAMWTSVTDIGTKVKFFIDEMLGKAKKLMGFIGVIILFTCSAIVTFFVNSSFPIIPPKFTFYGAFIFSSLIWYSITSCYISIGYGVIIMVIPHLTIFSVSLLLKNTLKKFTHKRDTQTNTSPVNSAQMNISPESICIDNQGVVG